MKRINYIVLYILFFTSADTVIFGTNINFEIRMISRLIIFFLLLIMTIIKRITQVSRNEALCLFFMVGIMLISSFLNSDPVISYLSRILFFVGAYLICQLIDENTYIDAFLRFLYFISVFALIFEGIAIFFPHLILILPIVVNTEGQVFYSFGICSFNEYCLSTIFIRNSSIFWEPGAYATYLIFGITFEMFYVNQFSKKRFFVFLISLICTFSTAGYFTLICLTTAYVISNRGGRKTYLFVIICIMISTVLSIIEYDSKIYELVFGKITRGSSSVATRVSSVINGMKVALSHPFFGVGTNTDLYMSQYVFKSKNMLLSSGGTIITNTVVGQFASYGIIFGIVFLVGSSCFFARLSRKKIVSFFLILVMLMAYAGERFFSFFPFVWMFYGLFKKQLNS